MCHLNPQTFCEKYVKVSQLFRIKLIHFDSMSYFKKSHLTAKIDSCGLHCHVNATEAHDIQNHFVSHIV